MNFSLEKVEILFPTSLFPNVSQFRKALVIKTIGILWILICMNPNDIEGHPLPIIFVCLADALHCMLLFY